MSKKELNNPIDEWTDEYIRVNHKTYRSKLIKKGTVERYIRLLNRRRNPK